MIIVGKDNAVDPAWKKRDFVTEIEKYMDSSLSKVLLVSGLSGTGKSIGVLQAMQERDAVYIAIEQEAHTSADEVIQVLSSRKEVIIVLDGYTWVQNRRKSGLDEFIHTLVSRGKRIIIVGTELLCLELLKTGPLACCTVTLHTTHMSFAEYCRLHSESMSQKVYNRYLEQGSTFRDYTTKSECAVLKYVNDTIIADLKVYARNYRAPFDKTKITAIVYTLLYKVIQDLVHCSMESLQSYEGTQVSITDIRAVADLLCDAGVLVKIPNLLSEMENKHAELFKGYRVLVVDFFLTYQFMKMVFPNYGNRATFLGLVYEANCLVDMYFNRQAADAIYYVEAKEADNCETGFVVSSNDDFRKKQFYLFECKYQDRISAHTGNLPIVDGRLDKVLKDKFPDSEVCGRFIIHPSDSSWQKCRNGNEVAIVNQDDSLYKYYNFDKLKFNH